MQINRFLFVLSLLVAGCSAPAPINEARVTPLASEGQLAAAEQELLSGAAAAWNEPFDPFTVIGNIHYVGAAGVSAFLITTPEGHILLDGGLPQTAPQIAANIERLGFSIDDVRYLLNSHAHFDHAGGLARLQRASGAQMIASAADRPPLEAGRFPYGPSRDLGFPPVRVDRVIGDGDRVELGGVTLTAHLTPGHTPGCTSWKMDVTGADGARHRAFFHCGATVAGQSLAPPAYPSIVADFRATFARIGEIQADVMLTNHPELMDLRGRRARQLAGEANAFVDAAALPALNDRLAAAFEAELERQSRAAR